MRYLFNNISEAFSHKTTKELQKSIRLFGLLSNPLLSSLGIKVMRRFGHRDFVITRKLIRWLFSPFFAGTSLEQAEEKVSYLSDFRVYSYLNYAVEEVDKELEFDKNCQIVVDLLTHASKHQNIPFSVCKPTSLGHKDLFCKVSSKHAFNDSECQSWQRAINRFHTCCLAAQKHNVGLLIDAEEYNMQSAVDGVVVDLMREFNNKKAVVYNTIQLYLTDGFSRLQEMHRVAIDNKFRLGVKLVRGAYMEKERERAKKLQIPSPICKTKEETDIQFNEAVRYCLQCINTVSVVMGSHNEQSALLAVELLEKYSVSPSDHRIWFSQLLGMCDHISFALAKRGYNVVKFVPFGPMNKLVPYLARRAEENSSITGQTTRELIRLKKELERRKKEARTS